MSGPKGKKLGPRRSCRRPLKINANTPVVGNNIGIKRRKIHCSSILECSEDMKVNWDSRCSPGYFVTTVIKYLIPNAAKVERIKEAGFDGLLDIRCITLQKPICKWISLNFDCVNSNLAVGKTEKKPISFVEEDVERILGIPRGESCVKLDGEESEISTLLAELGVDLNKDEGMTASWEHVLNYVIGEEADDTFLRAFIIYAFGVLLDPNTRRTVRFNLLYSLVDLTKVKQLNWCRFVYESTVDGIRNYQTMSKSETERTRYINGSMYLMMIWYVEKTVIKANCSERKLPLCSWWTEDGVADRITEEIRENKKFGNANVNPQYVTDNEKQSIAEVEDVIEISSQHTFQIDGNVDATGNEVICKIEEFVVPEAKFEKINSYLCEIEGHRGRVDYHAAEITRKIVALKREVGVLKRELHTSRVSVDRMCCSAGPSTQVDPNTIPEVDYSNPGPYGSMGDGDCNVERPDLVRSGTENVETVVANCVQGHEKGQSFTDEANSKHRHEGSGLQGKFGSVVTNNSQGGVHLEEETEAHIYCASPAIRNCRSGISWPSVAVKDQMEKMSSSDVYHRKDAVNEHMDISEVSLRGYASDYSHRDMVNYDGVAVNNGVRENMDAIVTEKMEENVGYERDSCVGEEVGKGEGNKGSMGEVENEAGAMYYVEEQLADCDIDVDREIVVMKKRKREHVCREYCTTNSPSMSTIHTSILFPTASMTHSVAVLTHGILDPKEVVFQMFGCQLEKADLMSLMPFNWVKSAVVNIIVNMFNAGEGQPLGKRCRIYLDPGTTGFLVEGDEVGNRRQQLRNLCNEILSVYDRKKIASAEMIFLPCLHLKRWFVLVVNLRDERIDVLDCESSDKILPIHRRLVNNLRERVSYLLSTVENEKACIVKTLAAKRGEVPKSDTWYDCGLWAIVYMHMWDGCMLLPLVPGRVADYRKYYVASILQGNMNKLKSKFLLNQY